MNNRAADDTSFLQLYTKKSGAQVEEGDSRTRPDRDGSIWKCGRALLPVSGVSSCV